MKRKATHLSDGGQQRLLPSEPERTRQRATQSTRFSFLGLPIEVRQLILKELLWCPEPIDFQSRLLRAKFATRNPLTDPKLHINVLRTCKQLHEEGSKILYSNTIKCRAWSKWSLSRAGAQQTFPYILSARYCGDLLRNLPSAVRQKISKIHVEVTAESTTEWDLRSIIDQLRDVTDLLKRTPSWTQITIELNVVSIEEDVLDKLLQPFIYVRGRQSAIIKGIPNTRAAKLSSLMTSNDPLIDLDRMYIASCQYSNSILHGFEAGHGTMNMHQIQSICRSCVEDLAHARDNGDAQAFREARGRLINLVTAVVMNQQRAVFAHDPDDWNVGSELFVRLADGAGTTDNVR